MAKSLIVLTIILLLSKLLGFMRELVLAYFYGAGEITDIYLMAISCSGIFLGFLSTLAVVHTPVYQELKIKKGTKQAERYTNQINLIILLLGVLGSILALIFGTDIISIVARGFNEEKIKLTANFFQWAVPSVVITSISAVYISELNCKGWFLRANLTNCALSFVQVIFILLSGISHDSSLLRYSAFIAAMVQLFFLVWTLLCSNHNFFIRFPFVKEIKRTFILVVPIFISTLMDDINAFVDKMFGSGLAEGRIAALNYAHLIKQLAFYVFATALVTVLYPRLSESIAIGDKKKFSENMNAGIEYMIVLFSLVMPVLVVFAEPVVEIVYKRGRFDDSAVLLTKQSLMMYALALLPLAVREILIRAFQAMMDTKINMFVGFFSTAINIILNFILVKTLEHIGLALSTAIAAYLTIPLLFYFLKKNHIDIGLKKIIALICKTLFTAAFSVGIFYLLFYSCMVQIENMWLKFFSLSAAVAGICILYFSGLFVLRVESIRNIVQKIKERVR